MTHDCPISRENLGRGGHVCIYRDAWPFPIPRAEFAHASCERKALVQGAAPLSAELLEG